MPGGKAFTEHKSETTPHAPTISCRMIRRIIICSGDFINSVSFSYTNSDGEICTEGPWGGPGGDSHVIVIHDDDELNKISVTHDQNAINSLSLETTQGVKHGPFGKFEGTEFSLSSDENLLAFFGKYMLNATSPEEIDTECLLDGSTGSPNKTQTTTNYRSVAWGFCYGALCTEQTPSHKIARIIIGSGDFIHSVSFSHTSDGEFSPANPRSGLEGDLHEICIVDDDLIKISGTYGYYHGQYVFYSLLFNTASGQTYGPFGKSDKGEQFSCDTVGDMFEGWMSGIKTSEKATTPENDYESAGSSSSQNEIVQVHSIEIDNTTDEEPPENNYGSQHIYRSPSFEIMGPAWGYFDGTLMKPRMPSDHITKIIVRSGDCIDSLSFEYTFNGETYTEGPWGGHGGDPHEITIEDGDELIGISGRYGSYDGHEVIISLAFHTKNCGILQPFGTFKGDGQYKEFSFSVDEDRILSFWAWTGYRDRGQGFIGGISVQTICNSRPQGISEPGVGFYEEKLRVERITAQDSVNFAIRKFQDMTSSKAALNGATDLRGVSSALWSIHDTLRKIHNILMNLNANWEDASGSDIQNCITQLEDVSKHTERTIHMFLIEGATIIPFPLPGISEGIKPVNIYALYKLSRESKEIKSKVDNINMKCLEEHCKRAVSVPAMQSHPSIDEIELLGLKVDQEKIICMLLDGSPEMHNVALAAEEELAGTAKTILAEKIYQSTEVKGFFDVCFWLIPHIYLFKPFEVLKKMLLKLGVTDSLHAHNEVDDLISKLDDCLEGKRCLVVIDDRWEELCTKLKKAAFLKEGSGGRMLITTESKMYAQRYYRRSSEKQCFYLRSLEKQESLILVQKLGEGTLIYEDYPLDFRGDKSLPRSVFQNGDPLFDPFFCHKTLLTWAGENQLFPIIFHIYSELPSTLKICFAYIASAFPYNSVIHVDSLIRLWIVEEIVPLGDDREMKDIAECLLQQLAQRGLLRVITTYYHNQVDQLVRSVILHPNVHHKFNLAVRNNKNSKHNSTSSEEEILPFKAMFTQEAFDSSNKLRNSNNDLIWCHRLALQLYYKFNDFSSFDEGRKVQGCNYPNLQSLFFFGSVAPFADSQFTYLRVLSVFWANIRFPEQQDAPCWLDGLINLRYLGFIVCYVEAGSLGKSLCHLTKLETLDLSESIVSGLSEFIENTKVTVLGPVSEEYRKFWSPIPDMAQ